MTLPSTSSVTAVEVSQKVIQLIRDVEVTKKDQKILEIAVAELKILENALDIDTDVRDRITDILTENASDKQLALRQLKEITAYLKIAEHHLQEQSNALPLAKGLHSLIKKIAGFVHRQSAKVEAPWKTLVHAIDQQIATDRKKTTKSPTTSPLENRAPFALRTKDFAHIHAESFITNTKLEENTLQSMLECFIHYCNQLSHSSPQKQKLLNLCQDCLELINKFGLKSYDTPDKLAKIKNAFLADIQGKLHTLKSGESLLLPAGWRVHTMYMLITREPSGKFDVKMFNSGSGLTYHSYLIDGGQFKYQTYLHKNNIEETSIGGDVFLTAYLEILTISHDEGNRSIDYGKKDVYEALFDALGGTNIVDPPSYDQFVVGQPAANCFWASLMVFTLFMLGSEDSSRASYEINLNSLCDYFVFSTEDKDNINNLILLQTSAELFAGSLLSFYKQGVITLDELDSANEVLKVIFAHIEQTRQHHDFVTGNAQTLDLKSVVSQPLYEGGTLPLMDTIKPTPHEISITKTSIHAPYEDFSWTKEPKAFLAGAIKFIEWCEDYPLDDDPECLELSVIHFYENLPMPAQEKGFWQQLPQDDILECMQTVADINEFILREFHQEAIDSDRFVMLQAGALKSLAVVKNLALLSNTLPPILLESTLPYDGLVESLMCTDLHKRPTFDSNIYNVVLRQQVEGCMQYLNATQSAKDKKLFIFWYLGFNGVIFELDFDKHIIETRDHFYRAKEIQYLYDQLQNPEIRNQFYQAHPEAHTLPEWKQLVLAVGDFQSGWLPTAFTALKKQSFIAFAFAHKYGPGHCFFQTSKTGEELGYQQLEEKKKIVFKIEGNPEELTYGDLEDETLQFLVDSARDRALSNPPLFTESFAKSVSLARINPKLKDAKFSLTDAQELMAVMAGGEFDGNDPHHEMQVIRALSYFLSHKEKMQQPEYQALFRLLVFESNLLEKLLEINPDFKNTLLKFIRKQMEFFRDRGDVNTLCFFVECSRYFQAITMQKIGPDRTQGFIDPIKFLMDLIKKTELSMQEMSLVYKHLAASYMTHKPASFDEGHVLTLLQAMTFIRMYPESSQPHSSHLITEYESVLKIYHKEIEKHIKGSKGEDILNQLIHDSKIAVRKEGWSYKDYPICQTKDEMTSIDVSSGAIYNKNQSTSVLPNIILDDPRFNQLFSRKDYIACQKNDNVYEFTDDTQMKVRIILNKNKPIFQKEWIQGQWFELQRKDAFNKTTLKSLGGEDLVRDYHLWFSLSQDPQNTLLATDKERKISHRWCCHLAQVNAIEKMMPDGRMLTLARSTPLGAWMPLLWKDRKGDPVLLEIPQIGQAFTLTKANNMWEAYSNAFPGLKLSANQHVKGLEDFDNKIVLEDGKGNRKVLIPKLELEPRERGALTRAMTQKIERERKPGCMIFELDPKKGMHTTLKEQQLYLAYIELGQKNYRKAQEILRHTYSKAIPYTDEERNIVKWILDFHKKSSDGDPRASAVAMTALSLLLQDDAMKMLDMKDEKYWKSITKQYQRYVFACDQIGSATLTDKEDFTILTFFAEHDLGGSLTAMRLEKYTQDIPQTLQQVAIRQVVPKQTISVSAMSRQAFNAFCDRLSKEVQKQKGSTLITRPGSSFVRQLFNEGLYKKIKQNAPEARLQLNFARLDYEIEQPLINLLEAVWKYPEVFPDEDEFLRIMKGDYNSYNKAIYNPLNEKLALQEIMEKVVEPGLYHPLVENSHFDCAKAPGSNDRKMGSINSIQPILRSFDRGSFRASQNGNFQLEGGITSVQSIKSLPPILSQAQQKKYFQEVPFVGIALNEEEIRNLHEALDLKSTGSLGEAKTIEIQRDVTAAWGKQPSTRVFLDPKQVDSLKTVLLIQQAEQKKQLVDQTQRLLATANELPLDIQRKLEQDIAWKATLKEPITFHDLCILIANKDFQRLKEKNAALDDVKINALYNEMLQVLERGKWVQKIDRSLVSVEEIHKKMADHKDLQTLRKDPSYLDLSENLQFDLMRPTAYKVHEEPEYSLFEFIADIQLYQDQTRDLDTLVQVKGPNDNIVLQKIMGKGKSKVYLPILALKKADGKSLPVIVVTAAQYPTSLKDMEASSGQIFHQVTHTLTFERATDCSLKNLQKIRQDMNEIIRKKHYMIVTDKTVHCMLNKCKEMTLNYMERVEELSKNNPEAPTEKMPAELQELREILSILKTGVLDEADVLLNSKHEVNFTTGKPESLNKQHAAVVSELFESIYSDASIMALITPKTVAATPEPIFTLNEYKTSIKPKIAEAFIKFELEKRETPTLLGQYLKTLSPENRANIFDYLMNGDQGDAFVATINDATLQNVLAIVKEEINEILPITLRKTVNFHYGFSAFTNEHCAVPYVGSTRPSDTSRYGNPYELLNYTIQTYFQSGVPDTKIRAITDEFKVQAMKEMSADSGLDVTKTGAYAQFKELCGVKDGEVPYNLMRLSDQDIAKIASRFKKDKTALFEFLRAFVFPQVQIYPGKISSNHLTLVDAFESLIGFTGTPWNKDMYHTRIQTKLDEGTDGKTLGILWKNSRNNIHVLRGSDMTTVLDQLFKNMGPDTLYRTFKDSGALFNGVDNETVAREIMKRLPPHIKGVKFFNKENKLVILERGRLEPRLVEQSLLTPEECFTYYDQWNTSGKDIKQMRYARGFATIGKTLTRRDLLQCVCRFRELDKGQVAELVITPEVVDLIRKEFAVDAKEAASLKYILKFVELNQLQELERQILTCTYHAINHVTENTVDKIISRPDVDLAELKKGIPYLHKLLNISTEDKPYDQFGRKEKDELTTVVLQRRIDAAIARVKPLIGIHPVFDSLDLKKLEAEMQRVIPWALLPKKVPELNRTNRELTVEIEREVQRIEEINAQHLKELESQQMYVDKRTQALTHWNWTKASETLTATSRGYFDPTPVQALIVRGKQATSDLDLPTIDIFSNHPKSNGIPPVMTLRDIFEHCKGLEGYSDVFDLEASYNFLPPTSSLYDVENDREREHAIPFDKMQLGVRNMLMVQDKTTYALKMILIDPADAGYFYSALAEEKKKEGNKKALSVALAEMNLGIIHAESSEAEEIAKSPEWLRLLVQAKFFNGDIIYTKDEQKYLEEWIMVKGSARMEKLFYGHILRHKPDVRAHYPHSILGHLLHRLQKFNPENRKNKRKLPT